MKPIPNAKPGAAVARQLSPLSHDLDQLLSDLGAGVRSADHFNELEERGAKIASGIRQAFRSNRGQA
ncbi:MULTISPECIES: hypothetical protein [unclassified Novosphingobium]|uniref:hypothetical protein n=1 Tax=unclassified Novosphingobium TaxID=2644732 RepID=UPI001AC8E872|nr:MULTISPECIES: hypothetical protein [unclassified Novosphingobium]MBN9143740.1 hypothetical protein [Novosphingobium sp.]